MCLALLGLENADLKWVSQNYIDLLASHYNKEARDLARIY